MYMIIQNFVRTNSKKFSLNVFIVFSPWILYFIEKSCHFAQKYFIYILSYCLSFVNRNFYFVIFVIKVLRPPLKKGGADCINYFSREASIFSTALQVGLPYPAYTSAAFVDMLAPYYLSPICIISFCRC